MGQGVQLLNPFSILTFIIPNFAKKGCLKIGEFSFKYRDILKMWEMWFLMGEMWDHWAP